MASKQKMNKNDVMTALRGEGVQFEKNSKVGELRRLYNEMIREKLVSQQQKHDDVTASMESIDTVISASTNNFPNQKLSADLDNAFQKYSTSKKIVDPLNSDSDKKNSDDIETDVVQQKLNEALTHTPTATDLALMKLKEEEKLLDAQLRIQEKQLQLLRLQQQNHSDSELIAPIDRHIFKPKFQDIKHLVPLFNGDNDYDAHKWISDFERACDSVNADDHTRLVFFCQSMKIDSVAELFLRTDASENYGEIKANFLTNFDNRYSNSEIIDKLRRTTFRSTKLTVIGYILRMQTIAAQSTIDEKQLIQLIIQGFEDSSAHVAVLYPANNLQELKDLAHRYAELREHGVSVQSTIGSNNSDSAKNQRFDCSGLARDSSAPRRQEGSCFRCGSMQHQLQSCPKPSTGPTENRVALFQQLEDDANGEDIEFFNNVSVTFLKGCSEVCSENFVALFDSGSPISLIQRSEVPETLMIHTHTRETKYHGIGNNNLKTYGIIVIQVEYRNKIKSIEIYVVPDFLVSNTLLLGRDFLGKFGIHFSDDKKAESNISINHKNSELSILENTLHFLDLSECEFCKLNKTIDNFHISDDCDVPYDSANLQRDKCSYDIENTFLSLCAIETD